MDEDRLKSEFVSLLDANWPDWKAHVLSLLASGLTARVHILLTGPPDGPELIIKLHTLNDLLRAVTDRLVNFFQHQDRWEEEAFFDTLFERARRGRCERELSGAVCDVLTVFALSAADEQTEENEEA